MQTHDEILSIIHNASECISSVRVEMPRSIHSLEGPFPLLEWMHGCRWVVQGQWWKNKQNKKFPGKTFVLKLLDLAFNACCNLNIIYKNFIDFFHG